MTEDQCEVKDVMGCEEESKETAEMHREDQNKLFSHLRHISKTIVHHADWGEKPQDFAQCKVRITDISFEGLELDSCSCYFSKSFNGEMTIGNADNDLDRLLELCVQCMFVGEISCFVIEVPNESLYRSKYELKPSIKGTVKFTVELLDLHNDEPIFAWSEHKKMAIAAQYKERGVKLFRQGLIVDSFIRFSKAFKILVTLGSADSFTIILSHDKDILSLRMNLLNNMASCHLNQKNFEYVVPLCQKVLKMDPVNVKALYRNAVACKELQNYEVAEENLNALLKIEPNNTAAKEKLQEVRKITKEMNERYSAIVKNMFK